MSAFSERRLELGGVEIALYEAGQGEPLLFLHGAQGLNGHEPGLEALTADFGLAVWFWLPSGQALVRSPIRVASMRCQG